jgi:hydrogenase nickel incorporation protein HypA/HybF
LPVHEFAIAQSVLEAAEQEARQHGRGRIQQVRCRIGVLQQIVPELLTEVFTCLVESSEHRGAVLEIDKEPATIDCVKCGRSNQSDEWRVDCPDCGSIEVRISGGDELLLTSITVELEDGDPGLTQRVQAE